MPELGSADVNRRKSRVALLSIGSNSLLIILKVAVGLLTGSVSVLSEAIHSAVDLVAAVIAFIAVRASGKRADDRHPYGHGKIENISGTIEAGLIFLAAGWIIYESVKKLLDLQPLDMPVWGVAIMFVSSVVNILVSRRLFKVGKETDSVALQADAWHLRTDVYTSAGVMVGLSVIVIGQWAFPGVDLAWLDAVIAIIVAGLIIKAAWDLTRRSASDLLDVSLPAADREWMAAYLAGLGLPVMSVHHLRTRKSGATPFIEFHLVVDEKMSVAESHRLGDGICEELRTKFPQAKIQIHVEPCDHVCTENCMRGCLVEGRPAAPDEIEHEGEG